MSDTIIINYPTDEGLTINIDDNDDVIVNIIDEPDIIVNLCDDLGTTANNYDYLDNKPSINNVELVGNKTLDDLGIEQKKGIDDFYLTNAEKTQGALATGNAVLPTVKDVADRTDRLLVDFNVPYDTASLSFDRDKNGVLFSDLTILNCIVLIEGKSNNTSTTRSVGLIRINNNQSGYVNSNIIKSTGFYIYMHDIFISKSFIELNNNTLQHSLFNNTSLNDYSNAASITMVGFKNNIIENRINTITILSATSYNILAGSTIKIYRND